MKTWQEGGVALAAIGGLVLVVREGIQAAGRVLGKSTPSFDPWRIIQENNRVIEANAKAAADQAQAMNWLLAYMKARDEVAADRDREQTSLLQSMLQLVNELLGRIKALGK